MDDYLSLRSLEGSGRPFGTERSLTSPERARGRNTSKSEPRSDRADEARSKERTQDTDQGHEAERGDFSRELDELEVSKYSGVSSEPTVELAEEPVTAEPSFDLEPVVADNVGNKLAAELAFSTEDAEALLQPSVNKEDPAADLAAPVQAPLLELALELAPPVLLPPIVVAPVTPVAEGVTLEGGDAVLASVELSAELQAGSGSLDADTGGQANQSSELSAAAHAKASTAGATFDQALAETATKSPTRAAHNVEVATSVLRQFKVEIHPKLDHAMIHLNPAELGRISVKIEMERGKLRAVLRADKAETLELLERHVPELRASLEASGISAQSFEFGLGLEQEANDEDQFPSSSAWKNQTDPILEELEKRSLLARAIVNEKRVDTYA